MTEPLQRTVTRLLDEIRGGRPDAFDRLFPIVYDELRDIARRQRAGGRGGATLDTHALVHEAYLKLADQSAPDWRSRGHFKAVAATAMRHILVDYARRKRTEKRGGGRPEVTLDRIGELVPGGQGRGVPASLIALNDALDALAAERPRQARVVELKFFGGLTIAEIAEAEDVSPATVKRDWTFARSWLYREMGGGMNEGEDG